MRKNCVMVLAFISLFLITGCSARLLEPQWAYKKGAIRVHIKNAHKLSLYHNKAHTTYTCFYQLTELTAFDQLTHDADGIQKLLESKLFDPSVVAVNSKILHAGEELTVILDRAEKAKYFAIVTGFYTQLDNARMVRRHKIQLKKNKVTSWRNTYLCTPCNLDIELDLGPNQIEHSRVIENGCSDECR